MVDFLTKPFQKMPKNNRAKGVALKSPDIKIIMYVCTPLNKVFRFQGSKILVVEIVSQFLSYLNPLSNPFWSPQDSLSWKQYTPNSKSCLKSSGVQKKINKAQMVNFLTKPFKKMPKNNRAKGVALKSPDIKIIMYVCTPLNKVFGFQGSNQIFDGWILKFQESSLYVFVFN